MSERDKTLSIEQQRALHQLCWQFEEAWQQGLCLSSVEWLAPERLTLQQTNHLALLDRGTLLTELQRIEAELQAGGAIFPVNSLLGSDTKFGEPRDELTDPAGDANANFSATPPHSDRYQFVREIARGGAGAVWQVFDQHLHRHSAIKVLLDSQDNAEMRRRLEQEARICAHLQHPGIVPIHELSRFADGRPFVNMKLIDGQTLAAILQSSQQQSHASLMQIFLHACEAVAYAHEQGVIHRDLKPNNIMVGAFEEVQVMDWGLAKWLDGSQTQDQLLNSKAARNPIFVLPHRELQSMNDGTKTLMGSVFGTPAYMSPEQAHGELDRVDKRTDVFALGSVLCKILTGVPVYQAASIEELHSLTRSGNIAPAIARIRKARASAALRSLAIACIAVDPAHRPADASELTRRVRLVLRPRKWRRRALFAISALCLGIVIFVGIELLLYSLLTVELIE